MLLTNFGLASICLFWSHCIIAINSETKMQAQLNVGVFTPPGSTDWEATVARAWDLLATSGLLAAADSPAVRFVHIREDLPFTLRNVNKVIGLLSGSRLAVVVGPYSPVLQLAAEDARVVYLVTTYPAVVADGAGAGGYTFHMLPQSHVVHGMVLDVVRRFRWEQAAVLYDSHQGSGLHLMGHLMMLPAFVVRSWQMASSEADMRAQLLEIRQLEDYQIVVFCQPEMLERLFSVALRLSMLSNRYSWLVVNLNPYMMDYTPYEYTLVNFTSFQFFSDPGLDALDGRLRLDTAVGIDALRVVVEAARTVLSTAPCPPACELSGQALVQHVKEESVNGSTGEITFGSNNERSNVSIGVVALNPDGIEQVGVWVAGPERLSDRLTLTYAANVTRQAIHPLGRGVANVVFLLDPPFVMLKPDAATRQGNDRYEGFLVDLLEHIARRLDFKYRLYPSPDGNYGSKYDNGTWNGMIKELIEGHASLCLAAISITSDREGAIDFAKPYKQKQFNILMKKPKEKRSIFQFLWPLSVEVWLLTVSSIVALGVLLFVMDRISPNSMDAQTGRFNLKESLWFIYGSLVGAGTEMVPRTSSGRLLTGAWWFFALILISSYTANLAAFLTVTKIETPIKSIADLATQTKIKYGTVKNTYANSFLKNNKMDIFKKMWNFIELSDSMVDNTEEGIKRVKQGDYAFIWDAPINKFTTMYECDTMTVGQPFDEKGYGIGVPLGASYRDDITMAILNLNEDGVIQQAEDKWWSGGRCEEFQETTTGGTKELGLHQVAGVFLVLAVGAVVALVACFFEFIIRRCNRSKKKKNMKGETHCNHDTL